MPEDARHLVSVHAEDDPLAELAQSPLDPAPATAAEAKRRLHIADFVITALDARRSRHDREDALRHLLVCDPARAIGAMINLASQALAALEETFGDRPGMALDAMRANLSEINAIVAADAAGLVEIIEPGD
jgi:hypothetical protein